VTDGTVAKMGQRAAPVPADLLLLLVLAFGARLAIHYLVPNSIYPDEIFQVTDPAHRLAFGTGLMSWEWYVGIRSWLLPAVMAVLMHLGALLGDAPWLVNLPVALFMAAFSCAPVACAYGWGRQVWGRLGGVVAGGVCAVWIDLLYMSNHTLTEVVAANCLVIGLYLGYAGPGVQVSSRRLFWSGVMLGLTFVLRFHLAPALALAVLGICGIGNGWRPWRTVLAGAILPVLVAAAVDWATLGLPLQSIWLNFWLNVVVGVSKGAGISPFATLLLLPVQTWGPAGFLVVAIAAGFAARRLPLLLYVVLAIFLTHSFVAHKEYRFIYPAMPLIAALAGVGTARALALVTAQRPALARWSGPVAAAVLLAWSGLSLAIALSDSYTVAWTRARSQVLAFQTIARDPTVCGVGIYDMYWTLTGGYTAMRPNVGLYTATAASLPRERNAYNVLFAEHGAHVADPGYQLERCFSGDILSNGKPARTDCLWRRPGTCVAGAAPEPGPIWDDFEAARAYVPKERRLP
jgi:phosphatidylinositol glycan class B